MSNDELKLKYENLVREQQELAAKFREQAKELFYDNFKLFFELNPGINAVIWAQYTPYFNDGDTCEFGVHSPTFTNATGDKLDNVTHYGEYEGEDESIWTADIIEYVISSDKDYYAKEKQLILNGPPVDVDSCNFLREIICSEEFEDILKMMFGDHSYVVATREGFDVSEHDHD